MARQYPVAVQTGPAGLIAVTIQIRAFPPIASGFPAFASRSSSVQSNGRKRRSCSPVRLYVISCRDSDPYQSAEAATAAKPRRRYVKGATARPLMFIRKWFGDGIYESVLRRTFG